MIPIEIMGAEDHTVIGNELLNHLLSLSQTKLLE